jgi:hypothetical protein
VADLVNAFADFFAALLRIVGFIGPTRRRGAISDDLDLLRKLEDYEEFGPGSWPHTWLSNHITLQVAEFSGLDLRTSRRNIAWSSVAITIAIWAPLGWLTYHLVDVDHPWYAVLSGAPAGLLFVSTLGMLSEKEEVIPPEIDADGDEHEDADAPPEANVD